jgi:hypothetical protein
MATSQILDLWECCSEAQFFDSPRARAGQERVDEVIEYLGAKTMPHEASNRDVVTEGSFGKHEIEGRASRSARRQNTRTQSRKGIRRYSVEESGRNSPQSRVEPDMRSEDCRRDELVGNPELLTEPHRLRPATKKSIGPGFDAHTVYRRGKDLAPGPRAGLEQGDVRIVCQTVSRNEAGDPGPHNDDVRRHEE